MALFGQQRVSGPGAILLVAETIILGQQGAFCNPSYIFDRAKDKLLSIIEITCQLDMIAVCASLNHNCFSFIHPVQMFGFLFFFPIFFSFFYFCTLLDGLLT